MMVLVPFAAGVIGGGAVWQHTLLGAFWLAGYSLFFTGSNWIQARRRQSYLKPVWFWLAVTAAAGLATLIACGAILPWVAAFVPLIGVTAWQLLAKHPRSLLARSSEVLAGSLMCLVAWDLGHRAAAGPVVLLSLLTGTAAPSVLIDTSEASRAIAVTALMAYYFWSTIPYVKSLVREKDSRAYGWLSAAVHALGVAGALALWLGGAVSWAVLAFWVCAAARAAYFTHAARNQVPQRVSPKKLLITVGITETLLSLLYMAAVLV